MPFKKVERLLTLKFLSKEMSEVLVYLGIVAYTLVFSYFTILKHYAFQTYAFDLGVYSQALWTTLKHGRLFYETPGLSGNPSGSFFGVHFSPILFLILPIYAIFPVPETLLVLQSFVLALGALPTYWIARDALKSNIAGLVFALSYFLYTPLHGINWFDFHVQAFLPALFLFALYYFKKERWSRFLFFTILALMCIEFVSFIVVFIGLYGLWIRRKSLLLLSKEQILRDKCLLYSILIIVLGLLWFALDQEVKGILNPAIRTTPMFFWEPLGHYLGEIMLNIIFRPDLTLQALTYDWHHKLSFLIYCFLPLAFLSILNPSQLIMAVPWLVMSLLSNYWPYYDIRYQYSAFIAPFFIVSAVHGAARMKKVFNTYIHRNIKLILVLLLMCNVVSFIILSPIGFLSERFVIGGLRWDMPNFSQHDMQGQKVIKLIPADASVYTQTDLFPHICNRLDAYIDPLPNVEFEYIFVDIKSGWYHVSLWEGHEAPCEVLSRLLDEGKYGLYAYADGFALYKRGYVGELVLFIPDFE